MSSFRHVNRGGRLFRRLRASNRVKEPGVVVLYRWKKQVHALSHIEVVAPHWPYSVQQGKPRSELVGSEPVVLSLYISVERRGKSHL